MADCDCGKQGSDRRSAALVVDDLVQNGDSCHRIFEGVALSFVIIILIYLPVNILNKTFYVDMRQYNVSSTNIGLTDCRLYLMSCSPHLV